MLYKDFIKNKQKEISDFFKNVKLHEGQFSYLDFNDCCYEQMYKKNSQGNIKTVKQLKNEIPNLAAKCKTCAEYFMHPRNKSIKGLDVQMGLFLENILIDFLNKNMHIKAMHADNLNKRYPDCMILGKDKGILCYFEVKYHGAPFIQAISKIKRYCYEGSATLDYEKVKKQIELVESELDRPTFYIHWIDYPCIKGIFFETSEQVKSYLYQSNIEFEREDREGDYKTVNDLYKIVNKVGYTTKIYSPLLQMGSFEEFITIIQDMKKNGIKQ